MQMNVRSGHAAYQQGQVASADPVRIVVLLYEGAIRFLAQAQTRWQEPAARGTALGRALMPAVGARVPSAQRARFAEIEMERDRALVELDSSFAPGASGGRRGSSVESSRRSASRDCAAAA